MGELGQGGSTADITALEWRQIVASAIDTAIITTDLDGLVTSWNEGARRILGWTEAKLYTDIISKTCSNLTRAGIQKARTRVRRER